MKITVETHVNAPIGSVWSAYTTPADIKQWNAASDDWHTTHSSVDLRAGGAFSSRMEARDGSMGFDFAGTYTKVVPNKLIEYSFGDRIGVVEFEPAAAGVTVRVTFDAETTHAIDMQRAGWQSILDNFARYVARKAGVPGKLAGGCHCGAIRYEIEGNALTHALCHCMDCRRHAGAPMVSWTMYPTAAVRVTKGQPKIYASSENGRRHFCGDCGTGLMYENAQMLPGLIDVQSATYDEPDAVPVRAHIQVAERIRWMATAHELPMFERFPPQK